MNHRIKFILLMTILLMSSVIAQVILPPDYAGLEIVKEELNPSIIEPGQDQSITIRVINHANKDKELSIDVVEEFPFIIKSADKNFEEPFIICASCSRENTYYYTIDYAAVSGIYKLQFLVKDGDITLKNTLDVEIKGESDLVFEILNINEEITPNSEFDVELNITNRGTGIARDIKLELNSDDFFLKGTNVISLDKLEAGASKTLTLTILTGSSLTKNVYAIPVNLNYEDHNGNAVTSAQEITAQVIDKAELNIKEIKIEPKKIKPGEDITIQVRLENVGEGDAENVKLVLESEIEGNKESYLGRLEKDDDSPAFFSGKVPTSGEKTDRLTISYSDDLGEHTITEDIKYSVRGISTATWIIIGLIIVILTLSGLLLLSYFYRFCKCHLKGKKCPMFKEHISETVVKVKGAFKK